MQPEQPAQGATRSHCTRPGSRTHMMAIRMRGGALASVRQCELCGWIDFDDLDEQVRVHVAEGLRQATEGEDRAVLLRFAREYVDPGECSFDHHGGCQAHGWLSPRPGEQCPNAEVRALLARLVGPWEPAPDVVAPNLLLTGEQAGEPAEQPACTCERVETGMPGRGETVLGRRAPGCTVHAEPARGGTLPASDQTNEETDRG
ncbi:hypothetical protein ACQP1P_38705 [Dactylosporangium sp. CA-052675]|uniref:hypothetical protein n=1 Tax=Dactylosporangium sp. CA-052675 TaxID=3239927 RepID=UPI003D8EFBB4